MVRLVWGGWLRRVAQRQGILEMASSLGARLSRAAFSMWLRWSSVERAAAVHAWTADRVLQSVCVLKRRALATSVLRGLREYMRRASRVARACRGLIKKRIWLLARQALHLWRLRSNCLALLRAAIGAACKSIASADHPLTASWVGAVFGMWRMVASQGRAARDVERLAREWQQQQGLMAAELARQRAQQLDMEQERQREIEEARAREARMLREREEERATEERQREAAYRSLVATTCNKTVVYQQDLDDIVPRPLGTSSHGYQDVGGSGGRVGRRQGAGGGEGTDNLAPDDGSDGAGGGVGGAAESAGRASVGWQYAQQAAAGGLWGQGQVLELVPVRDRLDRVPSSAPGYDWWSPVAAAGQEFARPARAVCKQRRLKMSKTRRTASREKGARSARLSLGDTTDGWRAPGSAVSGLPTRVQTQRQRRWIPGYWSVSSSSTPLSRTPTHVQTPRAASLPPATPLPLAYGAQTRTPTAPSPVPFMVADRRLLGGGGSGGGGGGGGGGRELRQGSFLTPCASLLRTPAAVRVGAQVL